MRTVIETADERGYTQMKQVVHEGHEGSRINPMDLMRAVGNFWTRMLNTLRNLFGKPKPTVDVEWLRRLAESDIFVISATVSEGIDATTMTQGQLLAEIREALERDEENQKRGYGVFIYTSDNQRRLPFFTSNKHVEQFCGEYSKERNRVYPFMWLQTKGTFLAKIVPSSCDLVVMNDKSPDERVLSTDELAALRRMWG